MGGTSFDVSLVRDGYIKFTRETWLGGRVHRAHDRPLGRRRQEHRRRRRQHRVDRRRRPPARRSPQRGGRTGPRVLRPAATEPTVTDAAVVLGYIDPAYFLGGRMRLDAVARSDVLVREIAEPLGHGAERPRTPCSTIANEHMVGASATSRSTRASTRAARCVVAGGGAGGLTIGRIAESSAVTACSPRVPLGAVRLRRPLLRHRHRVQRQPASRHQPVRLRGGQSWAGAAGRADRRVLRAPTDPSRSAAEFFVEARYPYQVWELEVPLPAAVRADSRRRSDGQAFHASTSASSPSASPDSTSSASTGRDARRPLPETRARARRARRSPRTRAGLRPPAHGSGRGAARHAMLQGRGLSAGHSLAGPAIIEEPTTTVVVYPGWLATVTATGDYLAELPGGAQ